MKLLIKNGHILDPCTNLEGIFDVLTEDDKIIKIEKDIKEDADRIIDASSCYVMPGFIDLHVHLRDPGYTHKETLKSGGQAAARGGVTTVCAMPNTKPAVDTREKVERIQERALLESPVHVIQLGSITVGQRGEKLADITGMARAGCHAVSEDGKSVMDVSLYRQGLAVAARNYVAVFAHCEDIGLRKNGVMNAGAKAESFGLKGITNKVEDVIVRRDIELARETGVRLHLCHCSTRDSARLLAQGKEMGVDVTGEVCPHHFTLSTEDIMEDHGRFKMNPPLRDKEDVEALRQAIHDGVFDVIATDHAPHTEEEKNCSIGRAAFGIVGLETVAAITYTELVMTGILTPMQMAEKLSYNPARILGLNRRGRLGAGMEADIVLFDANAEYAIDREKFVSKGHNTPFHGKKVKGLVRCTIVGGEVVYECDEI